jgi:hypothetical protein
VRDREASNASSTGAMPVTLKEGDWLNGEVVRGPFSLFSHFSADSAVGASVAKVALMAWGFLQIGKKKTAVEAGPGERALSGSVRPVSPPPPPHSAVLGPVGCFADSVLVVGLHEGRFRAQ